MARKPRIHIPGAFYHVMLRGNAGDDIFLSDKERHHFYLLLQDGVIRFNHRIHAFCLMDNHVHLVIQIGETSLSTIMQNLSFRYTRWFNSQHKRAGHLFQGRFKSILVEEDSYLLELVRYIHLNPVRAGICGHLKDHQWNSNAAYLGHEIISWIHTDEVLARFSMQPQKARMLFAKFMNEGVNETHRDDFHGGEIDTRILGDEHFAERVLFEDKIPITEYSLDSCIETVCQHYDLEAAALSEPGSLHEPSEARAVIAWLMRNCGKESLTTLAQLFGRDISTMSSAVRRLEERMRQSDHLRATIGEIKNKTIKTCKPGT